MGKLLIFLKKWNKKKGLIEMSKKYDLEFNNNIYENKFQKEIENNFEGIYNKTTLSSFKNLIIQQIERKDTTIHTIKHIFKNNYIRNILYAISNNHSTIRANCTQINNIIKKKFSEDKIEKYNLHVYLKLKDAYKLNKIQKEKTENKNNNVIDINAIQILEMVDELKKSNSFIDNILLFGISTGSRCIEIIDKRVSDYKKSSIKSHILQIGVAKQNSNIDLKKIIHKPILFDLSQDYILNLIKNIRQSIDVKNKSKKQLTNTYNKYLNKRVKELCYKYGFIMDDKDIKFHFLRRIYLMYGFHVFGIPSKNSLLSFISYVAGHSSYNSVASYTNIHIKHINIVNNNKKEEKKDVKETILDLKTSEYMNNKERGQNAKIIRKQKLIKLINKLKDINIKPTYKTLNTFGYGSRIITQTMKELNDS